MNQESNEDAKRKRRKGFGLMLKRRIIAKKAPQSFDVCSSPSRIFQMPNEIGFSNSPSSRSCVSEISGATGLPSVQRVDSFRMMSILPRLANEEKSVERSLFSKSDDGDGTLFLEESTSTTSTPIKAVSLMKQSEPAKKENIELPSSPSFLTRTLHFQSLISTAFKTVDVDGNGRVDIKELYSGMLLIHLNLAKYAGSAACKPPSRKYVEEIFQKVDIDKSGDLDEKEFGKVMAILFSNIAGRIIMQWVFTLMVVPFLSKYVIECLITFHKIAVIIWSEVDSVKSIFDFLWNQIYITATFVVSFIPGAIKQFLGNVSIPESFLSTIPLTTISCILGSIAVPWAIFKFDNFIKEISGEQD